MMAAGIGIGLLVVPLVASISEDALRSVPASLREASYGVGAKKSTTVLRVVVPAAVSGIVAAFIVATSRAIGETMVAALAAGASGGAQFTDQPDRSRPDDDRGDGRPGQRDRPGGGRRASPSPASSSSVWCCSS